MSRRNSMTILVTILAGSAFSALPANLFSQTPASGATPPTVITQQGKLRGTQGPDDNLVFQAIPFAQPPVGELRWKEPQPPKSWQGARDASSPPPACMQLDWKWNTMDAKAGSEDCLYLNVVTPSLHQDHPLPVMFWIHGGANYNGSGRYFTGETLTRHGVVLVSINYRLGVFGFLAHPELTKESPHHSSGNYAILDQIAALRWVRKNIASFGGDPRNVTIIGQSAGAMDVGTLLVTPESNGLYSKAIAESGGPIAPSPTLPTLHEEEEVGRSFAEAAGASSPDQIAALRAMSAQQILDACNRYTAPDPEGVPTHQGPSPNVDGWILTSQPAAAVHDGRVHPGPLLIGSNIQEFSFSRSSVIASDAPSEPAEELKKMIAKDFGEQAQAAVALYGLDRSDHPAPDPEFGTVGTQLMTDSNFRCPATITGRWLSRNRFQVWRYQFERPLPGAGADSTRHSGELPYVFGWAQNSSVRIMGATFGPLDKQISEQMQEYWTNFAKTGNPNGGDLPRWDIYAVGSPSVMRFTSQGPLSDRDHRLDICTQMEKHLAHSLGLPN